MKIFVDCSNLRVGGGVQVGMSFLRDLASQELKERFVILLSPQLKAVIDTTGFPSNFTFLFTERHFYKSIFLRAFYLDRIEKNNKPDIVFCVFGPSYNKSSVPKVVGYAIPHYIYDESPYFREISSKARLKLFINRIVKVFCFKNFSSHLVFETTDAADKFVSKFKIDQNMVSVVPNRLNPVFLDSGLWKERFFKFNTRFAIMCVSAPYRHKNLQIIPSVIDFLVGTLGVADFKFVVTVHKTDLKFGSNYDPYIEYLGPVDIYQLPYLYKSAHCLFMPTLLEVFSTTFLEAMYMKVPIVTTEFSFTRTICKDAALYFDADNFAQAAQMIMTIMQNRLVRDSMIDKGYAYVQQYLESTDRTNEYMRILKEVFNGKR